MFVPEILCRPHPSNAVKWIFSQQQFENTPKLLSSPKWTNLGEEGISAKTRLYFNAKLRDLSVLSLKEIKSSTIDFSNLTIRCYPPSNPAPDSRTTRFFDRCSRCARALYTALLWINQQHTPIESESTPIGERHLSLEVISKCWWSNLFLFAYITWLTGLPNNYVHICEGT